MLQFLKVFLRGIITTVLLPVIALIWVLYAVYCIGVFVVMFFKGVIDFFKGNSFNPDMVEDLESRRMLLEKEKQNEQAKDALSMMYQNAMAQTIYPQQEPDQTNTTNTSTFDENPELFGGDEYESDAYQPDPVENEESNENYGDFDDDDLRSN
jgi:hypothetical protein